MGRQMAGRLLEARHQVQAFNRSRGPTDQLAALGATAANSAAEAAARGDFVLTALPTPASVDAVYEEFASLARPGQIFVDHSTVSLEQNRRCAAKLRQRGAQFLDAPVSGGPAGAQAGTLTVMVGGEKEAFESALPVFQAFGKNIRLCGPTGAGQAVKLVNQLLVGVHTAGIAEAAVFGAGPGPGPPLLLEGPGTSLSAPPRMNGKQPHFSSPRSKPQTPVKRL